MNKSIQPLNVAGGGWRAREAAKEAARVAIGETGQGGAGEEKKGQLMNDPEVLQKEYDHMFSTITCSTFTLGLLSWQAGELLEVGNIDYRRRWTNTPVGIS